MTDDNPTPPTDPPAPPSDPPAPPSDPPTPPSDPPHKAHDDGPILAAIGELKNMITGLATVASTDETPARKPWFARGGKS
jgi:hypothetical protein